MTSLSGDVDLKGKLSLRHECKKERIDKRRVGLQYKAKNCNCFVGGEHALQQAPSHMKIYQNDSVIR